MIYQNWFFIKQYGLSPFEFDGKALNGIQSNRIESEMPFTLLTLISLLYNLPSLPKKLLKLVSLGKGQIQKAMLAGIWQNQWLEYQRPGSGSTVLLDGATSDNFITGILALVYKQQEIGLGIPSFCFHMGLSLLKKDWEHPSWDVRYSSVPCTHTCQ